MSTRIEGSGNIQPNTPKLEVNISEKINTPIIISNTNQEAPGDNYKAESRHKKQNINSGYDTTVREKTINNLKKEIEELKKQREEFSNDEYMLRSLEAKIKRREESLEYNKQQLEKIKKANVLIAKGMHPIDAMGQVTDEERIEKAKKLAAEREEIAKMPEGSEKEARRIINAQFTKMNELEEKLDKSSDEIKAKLKEYKENLKNGMDPQKAQKILFGPEKNAEEMINDLAEKTGLDKKLIIDLLGGVDAFQKRLDDAREEGRKTGEENTRKLNEALERNKGPKVR